MNSHTPNKKNIEHFERVTDTFVKHPTDQERIAELEAEVKRKDEQLQKIFAETDKRYPDGGSANDIERVIKEVRKDAPAEKPH